MYCTAFYNKTLYIFSQLSPAISSQSALAPLPAISARAIQLQPGNPARDPLLPPAPGRSPTPPQHLATLQEPRRDPGRRRALGPSPPCSRSSLCSTLRRPPVLPISISRGRTPPPAPRRRPALLEEEAEEEHHLASPARSPGKQLAF